MSHHRCPKLVATCLLLISGAALAAQSKAQKPGPQKPVLPPDSRAILVEDYTGTAAAFVADQDAGTAQVVMLSDKKQGKSHVSDDGQLIFLRPGDNDKLKDLVTHSLNNRFLAGSWVRCEDPDGGPKDSIVFDKGGTGHLPGSPPYGYKFAYGFNPQGVSIVANMGDHVAIMQLSTSPNHDRLFFPSQKTGHISTYVRTDGKLAGECSVK